MTGRYEGLFYIENALYEVMKRNEPYVDEPEIRLRDELDYDELSNGSWYEDEWSSEEELDDIEECFMESFTKMFPSFCRVEPQKWLRNGPYGDITRRAILESRLFYVCLENNVWSMAIELVQKEEPYGEPWMENLQRRLYEKYLDGMKKCLLDRLPRIGTYGGAWTHGLIRREAEE